MPLPRLSDDGTTVTLDLHGAPVEQALEIVRRTTALASARGRSSLRIVHGSSTSDPRALNRTIKHALYALLDARSLPGVYDTFRAEGFTLLSLRLTGNRDPARITLRDVR